MRKVSACLSQNNSTGRYRVAREESPCIFAEMALVSQPAVVHLSAPLVWECVRVYVCLHTRVCTRSPGINNTGAKPTEDDAHVYTIV